jgi:small conductance mechanosensitive channel
MNNFWLSIDNWMTQHNIWSRFTDWLAVHIPEFIFALVIFFVGKWIAKTIAGLVERALHRAHIDATLCSFAKHVIYALILVFVIIAALDKVGIQTSSFTVVIGAAGLAVGFALQGSLSNFAAGVMLIMFKPFKVGDFVKIADTQGTVTEVEIFNTVIDTPDNIRTIIPNSHVTGTNIVNYTANGTRRIDIVLGISYKDDIRKARYVIMDVLTKDPRVLGQPDPIVAVTELGESSVNLAVRPWVKAADYWDTFFALNENIKLALDANGITIPFPQRDLHIAKDETLPLKN